MVWCHSGDIQVDGASVRGGDVALCGLLNLSRLIGVVSLSVVT